MLFRQWLYLTLDMHYFINFKPEIRELGYEKTCLMLYANNKVADQPAHLCSLISAFVVCCLDSVMSLASVTKISSLKLASVAEQASLWSETPEDTFSHDEAQVYFQSRNVWFGSYLRRDAQGRLTLPSIRPKYPERVKIVEKYVKHARKPYLVCNNAPLKIKWQSFNYFSLIVVYW